MKDEAGAGFTITPLSVLRPMGSWWPNGAVFPPALEPVKWTYPSPKCLRDSTLGVRPVRAERHNPGPLLRFDKPSHGFCSDNSPVVLFVELPFYNTVVL